jgi:hypothetical protein
MISARIRGIERAYELFLKFLKRPTGSDVAPGVFRSLNGQITDLILGLSQYRDRFSTSLPANACICLNEFLQELKTKANESATNDELRAQQHQMIAVMLVSFESEFSFLLRDTQLGIRRRSDLAFLHLQRLIAADPSCRETWKKTFNEKHEPQLEQLGSVHLLQHGIWAFKANTEGARTDLVFGEPIETYMDDLSSSAGLVLTEWKKAKDAADVEGQFTLALEQTKRYTATPLAGLELTSYRYLIVVTAKGDQRKRPDVVQDGITYRYIVIDVEPESPSKSARATRKSQVGGSNRQPESSAKPTEGETSPRRLD